MNHDTRKPIALPDQTRTEVRSALERLSPDDLVALFRACATGHLTDMDQRTLLLVGMLAAVAIHDIYRELNKPYNACPRCGEDDTDLLNWIEDEQVLCLHCGLVYQPIQRDSRET
jgi:translation initiation factor 2 beta subunit (eIF-2beta)/eIF-5